MRDANVLILLLLIGLVATGYYCWQCHLNDSVIRNVNASCGTDDAHARQALWEFERMMGKTSRDRFAEARLIDLNLNEGRPISDPITLHRVLDGYFARANDNRVDAFELDQIEHFVERNQPVLTGEQGDWLLAATMKSRCLPKPSEDKTNEPIPRSKALEKQVKKLTKYTADPQNVHDSGINEQLRGTLKRLRETTYPVRDATSIRSEIEALVAQDESATRQARALHSLDTIYNRDTFDGTIGANECEVLALVYARSEMPQNKDGCAALRDALIDSLVEMSPTSDSTVCDHGRCARLIESLVLIDRDEMVSHGVVNLEQMRNDAYAKSNDILQECIREALANTRDPEMVKVGQSFTDIAVDVKPDVELAFKGAVKAKIEKYIDNTFASKMSRRDHDNLVTHCTIAIDSL